MCTVGTLGAIKVLLPSYPVNKCIILISLFFLNPLWGEVIVNFGDIGGIVDHYCLNILFITINEVYMIVINTPKVPTIFRGNAEENSWYRGDN
jgi:hypothetical protein